LSEPLVSIIVPTLGRPRHLAACLDSIAATVVEPHEVVCVPVADDDETMTLLAGRDGAIRTVVQPERQGCVQAVNLGLRAASGTYLMQINDDCVLLPHTVANAVRFLEAPAHDRVGQAAFFHDSPFGRNVYAEIQVEDVRYAVHHVRGLCYANFGLARRELYQRLEYWDDRFFMYGADPDFSLKVWHEAKLTVTPCPGALIHHAQLDDERSRGERSRQSDDNRKLFEKWGLD